MLLLLSHCSVIVCSAKILGRRCIYAQTIYAPIMLRLWGFYSSANFNSWGPPQAAIYLRGPLYKPYAQVCPVSFPLLVLARPPLQSVNSA